VNVFLEGAAAEVEGYVGQSGWDQRPSLFALVDTAQFLADEPAMAAQLGLVDAVDSNGTGLTPIEQDELPEGPLDDVLAQLGWPESIAGCAISQEIVFLPPDADATLPDDETALEVAAAHPERREARLVVAVLRDGSSAAVLRVRPTDGGLEELLTGPELAPNLVAALLSTLRED
jgi:hypothetical protein